MALTRNDQFEIDLRAALDARRKEVGEWLEKGSGIPDFATYQNHVGFLRALTEIEDMCGNIRAELEKKR